ncbi:4-(cytidine 5'-diphospho)-2-C-methyl-D-erythritol kinase [uncultured Roseovarius sp.]|uniref:4-(cytidine 5'-diphospho)-2-C-methyl-D-erythritol kinase n=1 Tax=uncultured Roseovarius sp. TaxID=293344 RepID=UPI002639161A|nr:4-(cytidine 5'-diphospho)-2-C-methyl-D-erythritol kinase [uncultured Roseovarius sp.]
MPHPPITETAPAKINLTLHVTGRRDDGFHLLDSLVVFADLGDILTIVPADQNSLTVIGPMAPGVPETQDNLVLRAAAMMGQRAHMTLDKQLPSAAGIGGGSSDAAACLRGLSRMSGETPPDDVLRLGADVPVCLLARSARMRGIGEDTQPVPNLPTLHAILVNPGVPASTPAIFRRLRQRDNPAMPNDLPTWPDTMALIRWLACQRNDLQDPALEEVPVITDVLEDIAATSDCGLARMSGSGATCFGLYPEAISAANAATALSAKRPEWWVRSVRLS